MLDLGVPTSTLEAQRLRSLDDAEQRQHDQEVGEVIEGQDARGDDVAAVGRLRAEIAETDAGQATKIQKNCR